MKVNYGYMEQVKKVPTEAELAYGVWLHKEPKSAWIVSKANDRYMLVCLNTPNSYTSMDRYFPSVEAMWTSLRHKFKGVIPNEHARLTLDESHLIKF